MNVVHWYPMPQKSPLAARQGHALIAYQNFLYITGGYTDNLYISETHCCYISFHPGKWNRCVMRLSSSVNLLSIYLILTFTVLHSRFW
jgi:hypothetical protein